VGPGVRVETAGQRGDQLRRGQPAITAGVATRTELATSMAGRLASGFGIPVAVRDRAADVVEADQATDVPVQARDCTGGVALRDGPHCVVADQATDVPVQARDRTGGIAVDDRARVV